MTKTREGAIRAIAGLKPQAPFEALDPLISLSRTETEHENVQAAIGAVATFCKSSKAAVLALRDAAAAYQPNLKRAITLQAIGTANCTDSELVEALAAGLKSDQENIVYAAAWAAGHFGRAAAPLKGDLQRIAGGPPDARTTAAARETLQRSQR